MGSSKIKAIIILQIILFATASPCMAWEEVSFRHKTAGPPKFKIGCRKKQGKHDAFPTYTCYDKKGNAVAFDPGDDWEQVTLEKICLKHKVRDNIRGCIKIKGKQDKIDYVGCVDAKGDLNIFALDRSKWEVLDAANPDCKPHIIEIDIPRGTIDMKKDDTGKGDSDEPGK